jgi:hypothetical protein
MEVPSDVETTSSDTTSSIKETVSDTEDKSIESQTNDKVKQIEHAKETEEHVAKVTETRTIPSKLPTTVNQIRVATGKSKDAVYSLEMHERCAEEQLLDKLMRQDDIGKSAAARRSGDVQFMNYSKGLSERLYTVEEYARLNAAGKISYLKQCAHLNIPPSSKVMAKLGTNQMNIGHYGIGEKGTIALAEALISNRSVTVLDLENNWIGEDGCKAICLMLRDLNKTILQIDLSQNKIGLSAGLNISTIFEANRTIHDIRLCRNQITDAVAEALANALMDNQTLERLDLSANQIGSKGGVALAKMLRDNNSITDFNISWNSLREAGGAAFAAALYDNSRLSKLNCSWNGIGSKGGVAFGKFLCDNGSLLHLDISNNRIGGLTGGTATEVVGKGKEAIVDPWKVIGDMFENNSSLQTLNINGNNLAPEDAELLFEKRQTNSVLKNLICDNLEELVIRNQKLKKEKEEALAVQTLFASYMKKIAPPDANAAADAPKKKK